jgi:hypothetical protein
MSAPRAPDRVDGAPLTDGQRARLQRLVDLIYRDGPDRDPAAIVEHAAAAFRLTARLRGGAWEDVSQVRLADGRGPILRLRSPAAA